MKTENKRGFTLTEAIIVAAILSILAAIAIPSIFYFINQNRTTKNNNIARSIFVAVQSELTNMKNSGTLTDISEFSVKDEHLELDGGYLLDAPAETAGKLADSLIPETVNSLTGEAAYYFLISKSGPDDTYLTSLLEKLDISSEVLHHSVCVEFNAGTGNVMTVFYSDSFDQFVYDTSNEENNLMNSRKSSPKMGVYAADAAGLVSIDIDLPKIMITDGLRGDSSGFADTLYCDAYLVETDKLYTITITDRSGSPILNNAGLPHAVSFIPEDISSTDLAPFMFPLGDVQGNLHAGSVIDQTHSNEHTVFRSGEMVDPNGGTIKSHLRVTWILDIIDDNENEITFENSIRVKYPGIPIGTISSELSYSESDVPYFSNTAHSYFAFADNSAYYIKNARHFSNMRYVGADSSVALRNFIQVGDVDVSSVQNFAPLNWIPVQGTIEKSNPFTADFYAKKDSASSHQISNIKMTTNSVPGSDTQQTGIFGNLAGSNLTGISINNADIVSKAGGNVGVLAGVMKNSRISLASINANVTAKADDPNRDLVWINIGGFAGSIESTNIDSSYNSGSFSSGQHGIVEASGKFSGEINVGGLVGNVISGNITSSYNNARVNIASAVINGDYQAEAPRHSQLIFTDYKDISIGGIAGKNRGIIINCYASSLVGDYYKDLEEANCGTIIGCNLGQSSNCIGLYNSVPYEMLGTNLSGEPVTKEELKSSVDILGDSFETGNITAATGADYHLAENYPYPVLKANRQSFKWEDINCPVGFDLEGDVYFQTASGRFTPTTDQDYTNYVAVNLYDPEADNYIGNLRVDAKYKGFSPLYARIQINMFVVDRSTGNFVRPEYKYFDYINYSAQSPLNQFSWKSYYLNDGSWYYAAALRPTDDTNYTVLPFIEGVVSGYEPEKNNCIMYIKVTASGVEPRKFSDYWSIDKLPWR